ncbi:ankyrin [Macrolepiota fuliginosa MF-IS2]|uniref:Ankyrin n=1 Tax=Macrolepiota fuliginosa MF-IS2 TaxID=1400762 RepID=A0A9P6C2L5_9AGAR|nr:ankyrin [Macrolepiota fuliginosa MF-IS2]
MSHSAEGLAFLTRLNALPDKPGVDLDDLLKPSLDEERELRKLFAQDKMNSRLDDPYVGLVNVFGPGTDAVRKTRTRIVDSSNEEDFSGKYIMPLADAQRRVNGEASMVADLDEFKKNWSIFTEGSLSQLFDWNNVIAAGGAVLSALLPLPEESKKSKRAIRKYYHSAAFPSSDVDLFLWGLTPEQAERKIVAIYEAVRDSVPWDVTCIRTKHTISIHSQYPYRSVQIVLRLYRSPAEVLAGFDIDAPCCAYDGERVWANPRAVTAMIRQCNTVDVTRRSPSYEVRLAKYAKRGFEVYVPNLRREDVDPTIYERSIAKIEGLARLLVLEKLHDANARYNFLDSRRNLRGRPFALRQSGGKNKRKFKGDLKGDAGVLEMNDYDVVSLHIPYGPGWNARRIEKLVYQTDLGMNSTFNPKNKGRRLHRHPAFFGTIEECVEDCCENCPEPIDEDERTLQKEEDEKYIRGRVYFMQENPGSQTLSGSFNPIDEGEWSEQTYIKPIQKLFSAIAAHDVARVRNLLDESKASNPPTIDLNNRDHVGRTALHVAILIKDTDIAKVLVEEGCRMISRLVDGRTALHLAAQYGMDALIERMFEKSKANKEEDEKEREKKGEAGSEDEEMKDGNDVAGPPDTTTDVGRPSSEDDWSSDDHDGKGEDDSMDVDDGGDSASGSDSDEDDYDDCDDESTDKKEKEKEKEKEDTRPDGEVPEDEDEPDVLDVNAGDWDQGLTPLCYAVLYSTRSTVEILLKNGADPNKPAIPSTTSWEATKHILPLFLTLVRPDEDVGADVAECLIEGGATSSTADSDLITVLHRAVVAPNAKILDVLLRKDPGAKKALNFPTMNNGSSKFPVVSALAKGAHASLLTLLAYGAKINPEGADVTMAKAVSGKTDSRLWGYGNIEDYSALIFRPFETALAHGDYIVDVLLEIGAEVNIETHYSRERWTRQEDKKTIRDWVVNALEVDLPTHLKSAQKQYEELAGKCEKVGTYTPPEKITTWKEYLDDYFERYAIASNDMKQNLVQKKRQKQQLESLEGTKELLQHVRVALEAMGAKTWEEIYGASEEGRAPKGHGLLGLALDCAVDFPEQPKPRYKIVSKNWRIEWVQQDVSERYDELFEAAFKGDNAKIEKLCGIRESSDADAVPVHIAVEHVQQDNHNTGTGLTPLYAAIAGGKWNTVKLIMRIAATQYHEDGDKDEDDLRAMHFDLDVEDEDAQMDENGGDSDMDGSDYSDETIDAQERQRKFIDIAGKISVRSDVHPAKYLKAPILYHSDGEICSVMPLEKAIKDNNFEAFVHIFNIQQSISKKKSSDNDSILRSILEIDNPKILDEFIRHTGVGIDIDTARQTSGEDHPIVLNDKNRLYLGLNIRGKKRADLARRGDPNAYDYDKKHVPLVWKAVHAGAKSIADYLASEKPLAAYKHFATNGDSDIAEWLRHSKSLESSLNEWLGWSISPLGESPLSMALLGSKKDMLPLLFTKSAKLMKSALNTKIKFLNFSPMLVAAPACTEKEIFDFLLKRGASPLETDTPRGYNIYHWLCCKNKGEVLEYLLERLPRDVSEELLAQRSKKKLNTPLQIAVKGGYIRLVKAIVNFTQNGLLDFDAHGFTPLHNAIQRSYKAVVDEILKVIPQEGLYLENGVGKTPYEDAQKRAMKPITDSVRLHDPTFLRESNYISVRFDVEAREKEIQSVIETTNRLVKNGTLEKGSKLANAFEKFVSATEGRLAKDKAKAAKEAKVEEAQNEEDKDPRDNRAVVPTFEAIAKAVKGNEAKRTLIHLKDVQLSVATDLEQVAHKDDGSDVFRPRDELEDEEDEETKEMEKGYIFNEIFVRPDDW